METLAQFWIAGFIIFWAAVIGTAVVLRIRTAIRSRRAVRRARQYLQGLRVVRIYHNK